MPIFISLLFFLLAVMSLNSSFSFSYDSEIFSDYLTPEGRVGNFHAESLVYYLIAITYVFIIYRIRFAEWPAMAEKPPGYPPRPVRHFTSWLRYQIWAALYAGLGLALLYLFFQYPEIIDFIATISGVSQGGAGFVPSDSVTADEVRRALAGEGGATPTVPVERLAFAVGATVALAFLPWGEPALRAAFQRAAMIPANATVLEDIIVNRFHHFKPRPRDREEFLRQNNHIDEMPTFYASELSPDLINQNYLEIYPRMEFIRWRFSMLSIDRRFKRVFKEYKDDLVEIDEWMQELRANVKDLGNRIKNLMGPQGEPELVSLHERMGIERPAGGSIAVTLYDDILNGLEERPAADMPGTYPGLAENQALFDALPQDARQWLADKDAQMRADLSNRLDLLRNEAKRIHRRLVQVTVCTALGSAVLNPRHALREFGLEIEGADRTTFDFNRLVWAAMFIGLSLLVCILGYAFVVERAAAPAPSAAPEVPVGTWLLIGIVMAVTPIVGGYSSGLMILNSKLAHHIKRDEIDFGALDIATTGLMAWSTTVLALLVTAVLRQSPSIHSDGWLWALGPAVYGVATAWAAHRAKAGVETWPWLFIAGMVLAVVFANLVALHQHYDGFANLLAPDNATFIGFIMLTGAVMATGYGMILRSWRPEEADGAG